MPEAHKESLGPQNSDPLIRPGLIIVDSQDKLAPTSEDNIDLPTTEGPFVTSNDPNKIQVEPLPLIDALRLHYTIPANEQAKYQQMAQDLSPEDVPLLIYSLVESQRQLSHIQARAGLDKLTGVYMKDEFEKKAEDVLQEIKELYPNKVAFLLFGDSDDFAVPNKEEGQQYGDEVLQKVVSAILQGLLEKERGWDVMGRYGGDEFGILFMIDKDHAKDIFALALKIGESVREQTFIGSRSKQEKRTTMSIGIAQYQEGMTFKDLREMSDEAHHVAKLAGKDTSVLAKKDKHGIVYTQIEQDKQTDFLLDTTGNQLIDINAGIAYPIIAGPTGKGVIDRNNPIPYVSPQETNISPTHTSS